MNETVKNKGALVVTAGTAINLALGVLYTWSIFKSAISQSIETGGAGAFTWDMASLNDPYAVCCLVFAFTMIAAGKCQDVFGPRITATIGGVLVGAGFIWISQTTAYVSWIAGFGIMVGAGLAFGYASATPAALKWYPPTKTGKITGIVVSGFGLASVYIAPLAQYLLNTQGLQSAMLFFGVAFLIVVSIMAMFLTNPPEGFKLEFEDRRNNGVARAILEQKEHTPLEMIKTPMFWLLWFQYFVGAGAGLMIIGSIAGMAKSSLGESAFLAVAILAIGNAGGRIAAGMLSDKIGRKKTLAGEFILQAILMIAAIPIIQSESASPILLVLIATLIGFNYGANLALFPSFSKDLWGMKNFGVNYGILFSAWGVGGFVMSRVSQSLKAIQGSFTAPLIAAAVLLVIGAVSILFIDDKKDKARRDLALKLAAGTTN